MAGTQSRFCWTLFMLNVERSFDGFSGKVSQHWRNKKKFSTQNALSTRPAYDDDSRAPSKGSD